MLIEKTFAVQVWHVIVQEVTVSHFLHIANHAKISHFSLKKSVEYIQELHLETVARCKHQVKKSVFFWVTLQGYNHNFCTKSVENFVIFQIPNEQVCQFTFFKRFHGKPKAMKFFKKCKKIGREIYLLLHSLHFLNKIVSYILHYIFLSPVLNSRYLL